MTTFPITIAKYIHSIGLTEITVTAYLQLDESFNLVNWEGQLLQLGGLDLTIGQPVTEQLFFLEGMLPIPNTIMLRYVGLNEECYAHVHIIPYDNGTYILLFDATLEYKHQQKMHQQVNESKLLAYQEERLLHTMEDSELLQNTVQPLHLSTSIHHKRLNRIFRYILNLFKSNKSTIWMN